MCSIEDRAQKELDEKNAELAAKIVQAKIEQIEHSFAHDLEVLKQRLPTAKSEAMEAAKDQAYLKERQRNLVLT